MSRNVSRTLEVRGRGSGGVSTQFFGPHPSNASECMETAFLKNVITFSEKSRGSYFKKAGIVRTPYSPLDMSRPVSSNFNLRTIVMQSFLDPSYRHDRFNPIVSCTLLILCVANVFNDVFLK